MKTTTVMATIEVVWVIEDCEAPASTNEDKEMLRKAIKEDLSADHVIVSDLKVFW